MLLVFHPISYCWLVSRSSRRFIPPRKVNWERWTFERWNYFIIFSSLTILSHLRRKKSLGFSAVESGEFMLVHNFSRDGNLKYITILATYITIARTSRRALVDVRRFPLEKRETRRVWLSNIMPIRWICFSTLLYTLVLSFERARAVSDPRWEWKFHLMNIAFWAISIFILANFIPNTRLGFKKKCRRWIDVEFSNSIMSIYMYLLYTCNYVKNRGI